MVLEQVNELLGLSAQAYEDIQSARPGEALYVIDDVPCGVQCYIRRRNGVLTIAFRGTDTKADWRRNFLFCKKTIPYGNNASKIRVHAGFLSAYKCDSVRGRLHALMTREVTSVRVTGHSLGAAMAVLCAVDLQYNFPDRPCEVVLFGCPRVGNRAFARSYDRRVFNTYRVENGNDIVTKVPLAMMGYRHVGAKIHVGKPRSPAVSFRAHYPTQYLSALNKPLR